MEGHAHLVRPSVGRHVVPGIESVREPALNLVNAPQFGYGTTSLYVNFVPYYFVKHFSKSSLRLNI